MKLAYIQPETTKEFVVMSYILASSGDEEGYNTGGDSAGGGGNDGPPSGPGGLGAKRNNIWESWDDDNSNN